MILCWWWRQLIVRKNKEQGRRMLILEVISRVIKGEKDSKHGYTLYKARTCSSTCFRSFSSWNKSNRHPIQLALCKIVVLPRSDIVTYSLKRLKANSTHVRAFLILSSRESIWTLFDWEPFPLKSSLGCSFLSSCAWRHATFRTLVSTSNDLKETRVCSVASCRITWKLLRIVTTNPGPLVQCSSALNNAEHSGYKQNRTILKTWMNAKKKKMTVFKIM